MESLGNIQKSRCEKKRQMQIINAVSFDLSEEGTVAVEINTGNTCSLNLTKSYCYIITVLPFTLVYFEGHLIPNLSKFADFIATYFMKVWTLKISR